MSQFTEFCRKGLRTLTKRVATSEKNCYKPACCWKPASRSTLSPAPHIPMLPSPFANTLIKDFNRIKYVPFVRATKGMMMSTAACDCSIHQAAKDGDIDVLKKSLEVCGCIEATDESGRTALHIACMHNNGAVVKELLSAGAQPNATDSLGRTALHYCMPAGYSSCVVSLLNKDADDTVRDAQGYTAAELTQKDANNY